LNILLSTLPANELPVECDRLAGVVGSTAVALVSGLNLTLDSDRNAINAASTRAVVVFNQDRYLNEPL
jgi:hypothetical protein